MTKSSDTNAVTSEEAVKIMRGSAENGTGVGPQVVVGALAHIDQQAARIAELEAAITNAEQYQIGHQAGYQTGFADGQATVPPSKPEGPPPPRDESKLQRKLDKIAAHVEKAAVKAEKATGLMVVPLGGLRGVLKDRDEEPETPPPPGGDSRDVKPGR